MQLDSTEPTPKSEQQPSQAAGPDAYGAPPVIPKPTNYETSKPTKTKKTKRALLIAVTIIVVLGGASAAAYFSAVVPNQPKNILKAALQNSLEQRQFSTKGSLNLEDTEADNELFKAYEIDFESQADLDAKVFSTTLEIAASGVRLPVEIRGLDDSLFVKVGDLKSIEAAVRLSNPQYVSLVDEINKRIGDQWVEVDSSLLQRVGANCVVDAMATPFSEEDVELLNEAYEDNQFTTITNTSDEQLNGRSAIRYELSLDDNKMADYAQNLGELSLFKRLQDCQDAGQSVIDKETFKELRDNDHTPVTLWVDKETKLITRIASVSTSQDAEKGIKGQVQADISYGEVTVTKPDESKPLLEVLSDFAPLLEQGIPVN